MASDTSKRRQSGRNRRQGGKKRPSRAPGIPATPVPEPEPPAMPSLGRVSLGALLWLIGSIGYFALFAVRESSARGWVEGARALTGGKPGAMAVAGWLIIFAGFGLLWTILLLRHRVHRWGLWAIGAVIAVISPTVLALFPVEGNDIVPLISGAGGGAFVTGMRWAAAAGFIPLLVMPFMLLKESGRDRGGAAELRGGALLLASIFVLFTLVGAPISAALP
jgi:hypothetical protein